MFTVGDRVRLRGEADEMIFEGYVGPGLACCSWVRRGQKVKDTFPADLLEPASLASAPPTASNIRVGPGGSVQADRIV
jgi:hypothetical protein